MDPTAADDDKLIAAAHHIVKSMAASKNSADDMILILSAAIPSPQSSAPPARDLILKWNSIPDAILFESSPDDIFAYLSAVDHAIRTSDDVAVQSAMARLEDELRHLMLRAAVPLEASSMFCSLHRASLDPISTMDYDTENSAEFESPLVSSSSLDTPSIAGSSRNLFLDGQNVELVRADAIQDLATIAEKMVKAGYDKELEQAYCALRRDILDECLSSLGVERTSIEEVHRAEWPVLDDRMKKWVPAVKTVVGSLLQAERRLCDALLSAADDDLREECFAECARGCVLRLLTFGDAVAICPRSPEKLFGILDMYDALSEAVGELRVLFAAASAGEATCVEAEGVAERLGHAAVGTLLEFGKLVQTETSKRAMSAGVIHPLARYVMNYMRLVADYRSTLDRLLDHDGGAVEEEEEEEEMGPLGRQSLLLISYLEANLEEKAKLYEDGALQCIFMMNNILYIVNKVAGSELGKIMGDNWMRRRRGKIRQYSRSYLRVSWTKVLSYLKDDGFGVSVSGGSSSSTLRTAALKERFRSFNAAFEEIQRVQSAWKVADLQLREELKISISENVLPAYRAFLGKYGSRVEGGGRSSGRCVKYTPEDLETLLSTLFEGPSAASAAAAAASASTHSHSWRRSST